MLYVIIHTAWGPPRTPQGHPRGPQVPLKEPPGTPQGPPWTPQNQNYKNYKLDGCAHGVNITGRSGGARHHSECGTACAGQTPRPWDFKLILNFPGGCSAPTGPPLYQKKFKKFPGGVLRTPRTTPGLKRKNGARILFKIHFFKIGARKFLKI